MTWLEKRLKERIARGGLKLAYDVYDRADREEWSPCLTTNCGQWGKCSTIVIFEYDERD